MAKQNIRVQKWPHDDEPTETKIREILAEEGLTPYRWSNNPHDAYAEHVHNYHKIVYVVSGSITFGFPIDGAPTSMHAGDRLDLPAGVRHNAVVGPEGVVCLEAHR